jgi:hypothetical protein
VPFSLTVTDFLEESTRTLSTDLILFGEMFSANTRRNRFTASSEVEIKSTVIL